MTFATGIALIFLAFAFVAAIMATVKAPDLPHVAWGWLAIALLIFVEIFYHGQGVFR